MDDFLFHDKTLSLKERIDNLVSLLTVEEKISQLLHRSPAIEGLGIEEYNWWNEALHGVARAGTATVFPQSIGLAATFNESLVHRIASVISDEGRAKYHESQKQGDRKIYKGLTFWAPNVNIFRDPRWGRGHETYGEDPYLSSRMAVAYVKGIQGNDNNMLKAVATAKHFAVHSGPEAKRHKFNARVSRKDLYETYLPAFKASLVEAKAEGIMAAYNAVNGEPACASHTLLQKILRDEWHFDGHVVSDCCALGDLHEHYGITEGPTESAAEALNKGCELNCGNTFDSLCSAYEQKLISEETIDRALRHVLKARFKLGMFDGEQNHPYSRIPFERVACIEHRDLAVNAAEESIVLLKNRANTLPLYREKIQSIAVIGPNAADAKVLLGNYSGTPARTVTVLQGIEEAVDPGTRIYYSEGCPMIGPEEDCLYADAYGCFSEAKGMAERADVVVLALGLSPLIEGEQGDASNSDASGDRLHLDLPGKQQELLELICSLGKPVVLVLVNGGSLALHWAQDHVDAIVEAWYPGAEGGRAVANILFGRTSPSGRLPVSFVRSIDDLPPFEDYSMKNRTYRYMEKEGLYPFGYGLSYSTFTYDNLIFSHDEILCDETMDVMVEVRVDVKNTGLVTAKEVVQLYVKREGESGIIPHHSLRKIKKLKLEPKEKKTVSFTLNSDDFASFDEQGRESVLLGLYVISTGGSQPDRRSLELTGQDVLSRSLLIY
ncbi:MULTISPECIES: glycoside hydrolase family 3 C-terminal domain-containing protein [unclassified Oceanispirochaeta]|uniref:glycoside hydrolase family 3 C-terminal domain-containing protein n=1 Tax=unclassified Oceanispirochaeta TaxID=2635722 RepID=UPI000E099CE6|nr:MULTISPECIES: glycoside hydrolase family 3 C-terminal domain-containing protein [unclassified Oceanispirochaeta]MBF9016897.1 glycoside hydrolase family 3 C-terminal domain-containing protein [Oceanispirochaeta sp. M2]NPD73260.1 glycoside hydrolase family 3 protein [Oceanispirochaeta sp. M1]RDG31126.1 glycoside hydrolase family 3 protein [Oceanispirochaeta sp. M1]